MAEEEKKSNKDILVVTQLPLQNVRSEKVGDNEYDYVTIEEALTEILKETRKISKAVA